MADVDAVDMGVAGGEGEWRGGWCGVGVRETLMLLGFGKAGEEAEHEGVENDEEDGAAGVRT